MYLLRSLIANLNYTAKFYDTWWRSGDYMHAVYYHLNMRLVKQTNLSHDNVYQSYTLLVAGN